MLATKIDLGSAEGGFIDVALAARYFQEAMWCSDDDAGKLWGKELYGPMVFVDSRTRAAAANEMPPAPGFEAKGRSTSAS
jgi:hypothetical protein